MGSTLLDHRGQPLDPSSYKKAPPPKLGEAFRTRWNADVNLPYAHLPGSGLLQFDLSRLTLADFRMMRDHYQVNASLSVLTFMIHQLDWTIECDNAKIRNHVTANVAAIWTQLVRTISQAFWAGYSPGVLQWDNDLNGRSIQLTKIKDLIPEECTVNWKRVKGWAPPGFSPPEIPIYDGIKRLGEAWAIPAENTFWYPLLIENGDWYGRKLLRPAFTSWFFSILVHLFSNRYFERFGEPLPVGRAPYDEEIDIDGKRVAGRDVMLGLLQNLRSRGAVVLPSDRTAVGNNVDFDYDIEYLESQMRGADFERYLMRLDEEISLALFTPLLMLRTADVGSYNLGAQHSHVYMQMLNALAGDMKTYIDSYILDRMVNYNFSPTSPRARIKFRKLGDDRIEMVKAVLQQILANKTAKPDLEELGKIAGLTLQEVKEVTEDEDPESKPPAREGTDPTGQETQARRTIGSMVERLRPQVEKAFRDGTLGDSFAPSLGFERQFEEALRAEGRDAVAQATYGQMHRLVVTLGREGKVLFKSSDEMMAALRRGLDAVLDGACEASKN
jgi:hypothetical protein